MRKKADYMIPFDEDGNQMHYADQHNEYHKGIWVPNFIFTDKLMVDKTIRGQSAAYFTLHSVTNNKHYTMFIRDVLDMIKYANIVDGQVLTYWTFIKRGCNYGIVVADKP